MPQCPHSHASWEAPEICSTAIRADGSVECHVVDDPVALGDAPLAFTLAMIEAVTKEFPVDPNRVTVAGLSSGGDGTWRMLERRPDLFAAAVPVVSWQAMKVFCDSFIRLDDIPLSSPWFDTSGGRLQGRIKYALNEKAKPVVELLRDIAAVKAKSKKEYVELAQKSLKRIDAITHPKTKE